MVSTQHAESLGQAEVREIVRPFVEEVLPDGWMCPEEEFYVNPTGRFVIGGPDGDCGLTGRKIIVDTYGGAALHGGGAFSGKDPSKVDRSAAYAARYVAKNVVAAELAERCTIQVAYAIGVSKPISVYVEYRRHGKASTSRSCPRSSRSSSTCRRAASANASGSVGRSTAERLRTDTSGASRKRTADSPGSAPTSRPISGARSGLEPHAGGGGPKSETGRMDELRGVPGSAGVPPA